MPEHTPRLLELPRGSHAVLLTSRSNFNYEPVADFIAAGLAAGERCLVLTGDGRFGERFAKKFRQVRERGVLKLKPLYRYVAGEQFSFRASGGFYLREGTFQADVVIEQWRHLLAEARLAGYRGLRVIGEVGWLRHSLSLQEFLRYEEELCRRLPNGDFTALCVYLAEDLKPVDLERLIQSHTHGFFQTREGLVPAPSEERLFSVLHSSLISTARLVEANRQIAFLGQLARAISYRHEPSEIARTSVEFMVRFLEARAGFLVEIDLTAGVVGEVVSVGLEPADVDSILTLKLPMLDRTCYYQAGVNGLPVIQSRSNCPHCHRFLGCDDGLCLVVPVKRRQERTGALVIVCDDTADLASLGTDWLLAVGDTIGTAYEYQKQQSRWNQENQRAERLRSLGILTSGIAHDFNNLLAVIIGNLQLAQGKTTDQFLQANLEQAHTAARDASALVRRVQEFYRPAARESCLVNISGLMRDAVMLTRNRWHNAALAEGINIEIVQDLRSAAFVSGAAAALRDALVNILINAYDALGHRGGTVVVRTWDNTPTTVNISISDNGCGIPPEALPHVFDPFFTTKGERGSGLGLGITHNIITAHGGSVWVRSRPEHGTTFDIILPAAQPEPQAPQESGSPSGSIVSTEVLLIDDEPAVLDTLKSLLGTLGCRVQAASGGKDALELLARNRFDAVFCDLAMPGLNGLEVAALVKSADPDMPFILVTGWIDTALDEEIKGNVDLVLRKPVMLSDLRSALQGVTRMPTPDPGKTERSSARCSASPGGCGTPARP